MLVIHHWQPGHGDIPYVPVVDFSTPAPDGRAGTLRLKARPQSEEYTAVQRPKNWTSDVFVSLQLATHSPESTFGEIATGKAASFVAIRNLYDNVLPLDADWIQVASEVSYALMDILSQPGVHRVHLALSCPLPLAFAIGMALGIQAAVRIYNWYADRTAHAPVIDLNKMRTLGWHESRTNDYGMCQALWDNSDEKSVSNGCVQLVCSTAFTTVARCSAGSRDRCACPSGTLDPAYASGSVRSGSGSAIGWEPSPSSLWGRLIHASCGSSGGVGSPRTK